MQVFARMYVLNTSFVFVPESVGIHMAFTCWSAAEIIRYSYYLLELLGTEIGLISWLRRSSFIILYPVGVSGEIVTMYESFGSFL